MCCLVCLHIPLAAATAELPTLLRSLLHESHARPYKTDNERQLEAFPS
jgi:hypothetical protein